jgi:hypothetical protein
VPNSDFDLESLAVQSFTTTAPSTSQPEGLIDDFSGSSWCGCTGLACCPTQADTCITMTCMEPDDPSCTSPASCPTS